MKLPEIPDNEKERLEQLYSYDILDTLPEQDYDNITTIASQICDTPISLITLVDEDRQWFKSNLGMNKAETPRSESFCAHAINDESDVFIIHDARNDDRFAGNPMISGDPKVIFYAGVPLVDEDGFALGTLCVIDEKPKLLTEMQTQALRALSQQVIRLLELRKKKHKLQVALKELKEKNDSLEDFAYVAAHDIKSPVGNIYSLAGFLLENHSDDEEEKERLLDMIRKSANRLKDMIDNLLTFSRADKTAKEARHWVNTDHLQEHLTELFASNESHAVHVITDLDSLYVNETALMQILVNLIANAIKYGDKPQTEIDISIWQEEGTYRFLVKDNGPGIPAEHQSKVFDLFAVASNSDRYGSKGSGMGLAIVRKLINAQGGEISLSSAEGEGTTFSFSLAIPEGESVFTKVN